MSVLFRRLASVFFIAGFPIGVAASAVERISDTERRIHEYEILREGKPVGTHEVLLVQRDGKNRVNCRTLIEIGFLGLTFYRFQYESEEEWDTDGLLRLRVRADDDGERLEIAGYRERGRFHWSTNDQDSKTLAMPIFPTNHWNPDVLSQTRVLNTLTGSINRVTIQPHQARTSILDRENDAFRKYRYSGELKLDAWYDSSGIWVGMRFKGRDGSQIEYRCRNCES